MKIKGERVGGSDEDRERYRVRDEDGGNECVHTHTVHFLENELERDSPG